MRFGVMLCGSPVTSVKDLIMILLQNQAIKILSIYFPNVHQMNRNEFLIQHYKDYMFSIIVILFEAIAVLFIGIFARTNDTASLVTTNSTLFSDSLTLMLGFTFMYSPFRKLSLFSFVTLLLVISIAAQTNILFGTFWDSCFNGFSSSFQVTVTLLIRCIFASLSVLITMLDFIGLFNYWQIYLLIAPIMTIGYSLISSIIIYGLKTFDGGGGLCVFLYSGICSLMIWAICIRGKIDNNRYQIKQSYINQTLGLIGIVISFVNWPKFNMGGALVSFVNVNTTTITSSSFLQNSALGNTFLGLSAAILVALLFASKQTKEQKLKYKVYIDCFINGGIVIASYQDTALNPVVCIIMSSVSTILTLIIHKYFLTNSESDAESVFKTMMMSYAKIIYRILFSVLGIIIAAIVVATRSGQSPELLSSTYSSIAGFEMVALIVVICIGAVFGALTAVSINIFLNFKKADSQEKQTGQTFFEQITDDNFFEGYFQDEIYPIYYDVFDGVNKKQEEKINMADYTTRVIKQSLLGAKQNPLKTMSITKNIEPTKTQPKQSKMVIQKNYSKNNVRENDVSKMKQIHENKQRMNNEQLSYQSKKQEQKVINPSKDLKIQRSQLKITESQMLPKSKEVKRRLTYQDNSQILEQNLQSKIRK